MLFDDPGNAGMYVSLMIISMWWCGWLVVYRMMSCRACHVLPGHLASNFVNSLSDAFVSNKLTEIERFVLG